MPCAVKRRKVANPRDAASSRALATFTKVSKSTAATKAIIEKNTYVDSATHLFEKKRKLVEEEEPELPRSATINRPVKPLPQRKTTVPETPQKLILSQSSPISIDTPTKATRNLFDLFCIAKTPTHAPLFHSSSSNIVQSTPEKIRADPTLPAYLPAEVLDLINLHAAFLTALSIHCAHNGTNTPVDLRNLCPDVARSWGKRRVTLEDIRRTLGVLNSSIGDSTYNRISKLSLSDYGHGKICVNIKTFGKTGRIARPVNEDILNDLFASGIRSMWVAKGDISTEAFIDSLPLEFVTTECSFLKLSPLLAKGQRRLEDMKKGPMKQMPNEVVKADGTRMTLLERLRAKQLHQSTLAPPQSKEEAARKAALGRIEEVAAVVGILSTSTSIGQQRISFTVPTVLEKLKDSFKTPISKSEGDTCIRILVEEIAPQWLRIVKMGKTEAMIVDRDQRPGELDIKECVKQAGLR